MKTLSNALTVLALLMFASSAGWASARAEGVMFGPFDVRSVFHVEKSENSNQVHYGIRLDPQCHPEGKSPVFAYWRRVKQGAPQVEPLEGLGRQFYGASDDQRVASSATGGQVSMYVRALKHVPIDIRVEKTPQGCKATPLVSMQGQRARLSHAFLQLGNFSWRVKYVDIFAYRASDGARVVERVR